jgi:hypothetical protein
MTAGVGPVRLWMLQAVGGKVALDARFDRHTVARYKYAIEGPADEIDEPAALARAQQSLMAVGYKESQLGTCDHAGVKPSGEHYNYLAHNGCNRK